MAIRSLRWHLSSLIQRSGAEISRHVLWDFFGRAYEEPGRYFHTLLHIRRCLEEFEEVRHLANDPIAVEYAIWFHDFVYEPGRSDNEKRSADIAYRFCRSALGRDVAKTVQKLVLATNYKKSRDDHSPDQMLLTDIDLSSLGQPQAVFEEDSEHLRREFAFLPDKEFRKRELKFFTKLRGLTTLYRTEHFFNKYERSARDNIRRYLKKLAAPS